MYNEPDNILNHLYWKYEESINNDDFQLWKERYVQQYVEDYIENNTTPLEWEDVEEMIDNNIETWLNDDSWVEISPEEAFEEDIDNEQFS